MNNLLKQSITRKTGEGRTFEMDCFVVFESPGSCGYYGIFISCVSHVVIVLEAFENQSDNPGFESQHRHF